MWFSRWKSLIDARSHPDKLSTVVAIQTSPQSLVEYGQQLEATSAVGGRSSLWRSASIGLLFSAFSIILQVRNGHGFELATYAHTVGVPTIIALFIRVLTAPLIFVLIAIIRNLLSKRQKKSTAKSTAGALREALAFAMLLALILGGLVVYGEDFFSSDEAISGESRRAFVADSFRLCVQKQRSLPQEATEAEISQYCSCVGGRVADGTTYRQLRLASALANPKTAEVAELACAIAGN
jgi:uncharacterized integral membrane protein